MMEKGKFLKTTPSIENSICLLYHTAHATVNAWWSCVAPIGEAMVVLYPETVTHPGLPIASLLVFDATLGTTIADRTEGSWYDGCGIWAGAQPGLPWMLLV